MSCSCGSTTCLCGIPCSCSVESCTCDACAVGLPRFCKICNKPPITDKQTDEIACSCFVEGPKALISENQDNPRFRMGNLPIPTSDGCYVYAKLLVNIMIPVPRFSQFLTEKHICVEPMPQSMQADARDILPTFISEENVITPCLGEDSVLSYTAELRKLLQNSRELSNYRASTSIGLSDAQNAKIFRKEAFTKLASDCTMKTDSKVQNTQLETEGNANGQEYSFYLPSIVIDDVSYPVEIADPVWRLPNPTLSAPGSINSCLNLRNPFYVAEAASTVQTGSVLTAQNAEKRLDPIDIKEQSNLKIHDRHTEFATSTMATGNEYATLTRNSNSNFLPEQLPYSTLDQKLPGFSNENSSSGLGVESQPLKITLTSASGHNDSFQLDAKIYNVANDYGTFISSNTMAGNMMPLNNLQGPLKVPESPLTFSATQKYLNNCDAAYELFIRSTGGTQTPEQNAFLKGVKPRSVFENEENDPMPFLAYPTTRKRVNPSKPTRN